MARSNRQSARYGAGVVAGLLALTGCGSGSEELPDVEIQVINAVSNDVNRNLTLQVTTPRDVEERPFPYGDSTNEANWVKLHLPLISGDKVELVLKSSTGVQQVKETCTVLQPAPPAPGWVRALLSPVDLGGGRHIDCADGFIDNTP